MNGSQTQGGRRCASDFFCSARRLLKAIAVVAFGFACVAGSSESASGQTLPTATTVPSGPNVIEMPVASQAGAASAAIQNSGLRASITMSDRIGVGYIRVQATVASALGRSPTNRPLVLRITPLERHLPAERAMVTELPIILQQDQSSVRVERAFPKWTIGQYYRLELLEDGVPLEGFTQETGTPLPAFAVRSPDSVMREEFRNDLVFLDCDFRDAPLPQGGLIAPIVDAFGHLQLDWNSIPEDWRLMQAFDSVVVPLESLQQSSAEKRNSLREWLLMGGTLVVLGAEDDASVSEALELDLRYDSGDNDLFISAIATVNNEERVVADRIEKYLDALVQGTASGGSPSGNQARPTQGDNYRAPIVSPTMLSPPGPANSYPPSAFNSGAIVPTGEQIQASREWLVEARKRNQAFRVNWQRGKFYRAGLGNVISLAASKIGTMNSSNLLYRLVGYRRSPMLRRGVDPIMGDSRSQRWLIPGVAQPPVYTFIGILTLFVLLVGPVAYRWTTRGHRSHLMFLIAPALALFTTTLMFTYSFISDGFGTSIRVRQLTWIDGRSGDAVERSRATLFAGISPNDGLRFDPQSEVMVYPASGETTWSEMSSKLVDVRMTSVIDDDAQRFDASILPSRTQTQFVVHQARSDLGRIAVRAAEGQAFTPGINRVDDADLISSLPFDLNQLIVRTQDGQYWSTELAPAGQTVQLSLMKDEQQISTSLGNLYNLYRPIGAVTRSSGRRTRSGRNQEIRDLSAFVNRQFNLGGPAVTKGCFEQWLNDYLFVKSELPSGMFIGISSVSQDIQPVRNAEVVDSVRYVMGTIK